MCNPSHRVKWMILPIEKFSTSCTKWSDLHWRGAWGISETWGCYFWHGLLYSHLSNCIAMPQKLSECLNNCISMPTPLSFFQIQAPLYTGKRHSHSLTTRTDRQKSLSSSSFTLCPISWKIQLNSLRNPGNKITFKTLQCTVNMTVSK